MQSVLPENKIPAQAVSGKKFVLAENPPPPTLRSGGGVLPYMGYIGMCSPKGYGFSAVLVINMVSNLADSGDK